MKKLFCVVVTDSIGEVGLEGPIIFHIKCEELSQAEDEVDRLLEEDYEYQISKDLDIFAFEVTDLDIKEI